MPVSEVEFRFLFFSGAPIIPVIMLQAEADIQKHTHQLALPNQHLQNRDSHAANRVRHY